MGGMYQGFEAKVWTTQGNHTSGIGSKYVVYVFFLGFSMSWLLGSSEVARSGTSKEDPAP